MNINWFCFWCSLIFFLIVIPVLSLCFIWCNVIVQFFFSLLYTSWIRVSKSDVLPAKSLWLWVHFVSIFFVVSFSIVFLAVKTIYISALVFLPFLQKPYTILIIVFSLQQYFSLNVQSVDVFIHINSLVFIWNLSMFKYI